MSRPTEGWPRFARAAALVVAMHVYFPPVSAYAAAGESAIPETARLQSTHGINDADTWLRLAARPASSAVARTEVVKFVLDRDTGRTLWFFDTERYSYHYAFAQDQLWTFRHPVPDHETFNRREYRSDARRFEMGSIVHYLDPDFWTLELIGGDTLGGDAIVRLFAEVRAALWIGDRLRFRPLSALHERAIDAVRDQLPLATTDEVFSGMRYQPLNCGTAFGTLRIIRGELDPASVRADQIVVLEHLPDEIPVCAGVVSCEAQAPLGHLALLCASRETPNMGLRTALDDPELTALNGTLVALDVTAQSYSIRPASLAEAEKDWARRRPKQPRLPRLDAHTTRLTAVNELRLRDASFAGAKAAQLGEVSRIRPRISTPGGFVIPVAHYLGHLKSAGLDSTIAAMLADGNLAANAATRATRLADLRRSIQEVAIAPDLVRSVHQRMHDIAPDARWIFRSSTNAEDLAGFTGAGLYRSIKVKPGADEREIARAIQEVWASVWLQGAFEERAWYRIDHRAVAMAILVQPFVDGASANGVAITANPFAEFRPGVLINAQALGGSVTGAAGEEIPEQHLVYTFNETFESELLSPSSRMPVGTVLLSADDLDRLTRVLVSLHEHFIPRWGDRANAVDVEFLIAGDDRHVVILQARPFSVRYTESQRMSD